ncbi:hypothetical protein LTR39_003464 [Cryomyces antarcticus]|nr:hypothetical protein LTR39_003464 [Cryomyces antarcticus]
MYYSRATFVTRIKNWDFDGFTAWLRSLGTTNLTALSINGNMEILTDGFERGCDRDAFWRCMGFFVSNRLWTTQWIYDVEDDSFYSQHQLWYCFGLDQGWEEVFKKHEVDSIDEVEKIRERFYELWRLDRLSVLRERGEDL